VPSPLQHLAYADGQVNAATDPLADCRGNMEKRLYIFAGFDDYRIAMRGRIVVSTRNADEEGFTGQVPLDWALEIFRKL